MDRKKRFEKICKDIRHIKIQGARDIAKAALYAYSLFPDEKHKQILMHARPTEPLLFNVLDKFEKIGYKQILNHFDESQSKINQNVMKLIGNKDVIFTHCHSTNVVNALIYAKRHGKKFSVLNTETRPLLQGRKTAKELAKAGIKVTTMVDSAARVEIKKADAMLIGCDAILSDGSVINKIGSGMFAEIAFDNEVPVYVVSDSWKFSSKNVKIEERNYNEIWKNAPAHIKIKNPAFEKVEEKYIKAIVSELGILAPKKFVKRMKK